MIPHPGTPLYTFLQAGKSSIWTEQAGRLQMGAGPALVHLSV